MITKLKYLSAYYDRNILPAIGTTIGKVFYTYKYAVNGRTTQYVIDLDTNVLTKQTIDSGGDPTKSLNAIVEYTRTAPTNDKALYALINEGTIYDKFPVLTYEGPAEMDVDFGVVTNINILDYCFINDEMASKNDVEIILTNGTPLGFTWDAVTKDLTLSNTLAVGTYTRTFMIYTKNELVAPTNVSLTINVI